MRQPYETHPRESAEEDTFYVHTRNSGQRKTGRWFEALFAV